MAKAKAPRLNSFSERLIESLKSKGLGSSTAKAGVRVAELSKAIGVSNSAVQKYIAGDTLPNYAKSLIIAAWLDVDVAWLMYGDDATAHLEGSIDYDFIEQLLRMSLPVFEHGSPEEVVNFILNTLAKAKNESSDKEETLKTLGIAISSAADFSKAKKAT